MFLQQDPEEYAAFVHFVATQCLPPTLAWRLASHPADRRVSRDYWPCKKTLIVDIGQHELYPHWKRIKPLVKSDICLEIIDDSHAPRVRQQLLPYAKKVDFAFVDGDHSYRGLKKDIFLTKELLRRAVHGAARHGGGRRLQARLR